MKAEDIINFAVHGELKQLSISNISADNADRVENIAAIISYINLGIIELYKRFGLATQSRELTDLTHGFSYTMEDDFLYITNCTGNDEAETDIPLNDETAALSVFQPTPYQLYIAKTDEADERITSIFVTYIAVPALIKSSKDVIPLSYQYVEALLNYIAYRGHAAVSGNTNEENNAYYLRFEASCNNITNDGLITPDNQSNNKLDDRGFK